MSAYVPVVVILPKKQLKALSAMPGGTATQHIIFALQGFIERPSRKYSQFWTGPHKEFLLKLPPELYEVLQDRHPRINYQDILSAYLRRHRPKRAYSSHPPVDPKT